MATSHLVYIVVIATLACVAYGWPNLYELERWNRVSRRSDMRCIGSGGKCYSTHECCGGFVCAVFNDYFAENPEIPGNCVKEKDLTECSSSIDCPLNYKCLTLSRSGDRYCIKRHRSQAILPPEGSNRKYDYPTAKGGLGSECEDDNDCKQFTADRSNKLCCQAVNRGRQGIGKICDRVRPISQCINKK